MVQTQHGCVNSVGFKMNSSDEFYVEKQNLVKFLKGSTRRDAGTEGANEVLPSGYVVHEQHKGIIERFIGLCRQVVPLVVPVPRKLTEAKVPYLEIQPKDTNEMRKMIDKLNIKTQSFTCNHRKIDEMYYRFEADIGKIYVSDDYRIVEEFFERVAGVIRSVKMDDERLSIKEEESRKAICYTANKRKYDDDDDSDDEPSYVYPVTSYGVDITIKNVLEINKRITAINNELIKVAATFESLRCHKC